MQYKNVMSVTCRACLVSAKESHKGLVVEKVVDCLVLEEWRNSSRSGSHDMLPTGCLLRRRLHGVSRVQGGRVERQTGSPGEDNLERGSLE